VETCCAHYDCDSYAYSSVVVGYCFLLRKEMVGYFALKEIDLLNTKGTCV